MLRRQGLSSSSSRTSSHHWNLARVLTIVFLCALALAHFNFIDPGIQDATAEVVNPPCPGGCPGDSTPVDTIPTPPPMVSDGPTELVPWYFSLLMLAF